MSMQRLQDSVAASVFQSSHPAAQWGFAGLGVVVTAVWHAFTGVLAAVMVLLFFCDIALGTLKAVHVGGIHAFSHERFVRGLTKLAAAMVGILLAVSVDLVLREIAGTGDATYFTSGILGGVSVGFTASAGKNLAYFFPGVSVWFDALLRRVRPPDQVPQRRASDRETDG